MLKLELVSLFKLYPPLHIEDIWEKASLELGRAFVTLMLCSRTCCGGGQGTSWGSGASDLLPLTRTVAPVMVLIFTNGALRTQREAFRQPPLR
jgi:hypothetical protein